jgi:hypothetical protein
MAEETIEKASGILPEAWYDLIARIVPGALVTLLSLKNLPSGSSQLGGLVVALVIFYIVGIFLDVFSECTIGRLRRVFNLKDTSGLDKDIWRKRDKLRPSQWQVVSKLFAEADMFKAVAAYSLIQFLCVLIKQLCSPLGKCPLLSLGIQGLEFGNLQIIPWQLSLSLFIFCLFSWVRFSRTAEAREEAYMIDHSCAMCIDSSNKEQRIT